MAKARPACNRLPGVGKKGKKRVKKAFNGVYARCEEAGLIPRMPDYLEDYGRDYPALLALEALVSSRTKYSSLARALLRQAGYRVARGGAGTFVTRVQAQELPAPMRARLAPLLTAIAGVTAQLPALDKALAQVVRADVVAHRFCTAQGGARLRGPRAARAALGGAASARSHHQGRPCAARSAFRLASSPKAPPYTPLIDRISAW
jgi:hypothetical protein